METNPYQAPAEAVQVTSVAGKLYSPNQIALASFLGSPVAAGWLFASNYRLLGQPGKAVSSWLWGLVGTAVLVTIGFLLPDKFPRQIIPLGVSLGILQTAKQLLGGVYEAHLAAGGRSRSWWVAVGVGLLCFVLVFGAIFAVVWFTEEPVAGGIQQ